MPEVGSIDLRTQEAGAVQIGLEESHLAQPDAILALGRDFASVAAWSYVAFSFGRWLERRRNREAGIHEPPTTRQLLFLAHLADETEMAAPPVRTRVEAATAIDDLLEERRLREEQE